MANYPVYYKIHKGGECPICKATIHQITFPAEGGSTMKFLCGCVYTQLKGEKARRMTTRCSKD